MSFLNASFYVTKYVKRTILLLNGRLDKDFFLLKFLKKVDSLSWSYLAPHVHVNLSQQFTLPAQDDSSYGHSKELLWQKSVRSETAFWHLIFGLFYHCEAEILFLVYSTISRCLRKKDKHFEIKKRGSSTVLSALSVWCNCILLREICC